MKKYMRGLIAIVLCISMILPTTVFGSTGSSTKEYTYGDFGYEIEVDRNGVKSASITSYKGKSENVILPDVIGEYKVTKVEVAIKAKTLFISKYIKEDCGFGVSPTEKIQVDNENPYLTSKDGVLFSKDMTRLIIYPEQKKDVEYTEPSTVVYSKGIMDNIYLKKLTLSSNKKYTRTGEYSCENLEEVTIPGNVERIAEYAFSNLKKLKKVNFNDGLKFIETGAFELCSSLEKVELPDTVLGVWDYAFINCGIKKLKLSSNLSYIGEGAFIGHKLKKVKIPKSVEYINSFAFDNDGIRKKNKKWNVKLEVPSYLVKVSTGFKDFCHYKAKATVTSKGRTKQYLAEKITKIKAKDKKLTIKKGKTKKIETVVYVKKKKKGTLKTNILKFTSSNKKVAKVTSSGKVKALKKGKATITVRLRTDKTKKYTVNVRVK